MPWYAAHAIMYFRFKDGKQDYFPAWENIILIEAPAGADPKPIAITRAMQDEQRSDDTLIYDNHPAEIVFAGIRKIIQVAHQNTGDTLVSGDEISYSTFNLASAEDLQRLANGESVQLEYEE